jgi:hypothetical protein
MLKISQQLYYSINASTGYEDNAVVGGINKVTLSISHYKKSKFWHELMTSTFLQELQYGDPLKATYQ